MPDRVVLCLGTKKGLFVAETSRNRRRFQLRGPFGAGVAVNLANVTNEAVVQGGGVLTAASLSASAGMTNVSGDTANNFGAQSTSGAGGGSVGVAGSASINIVNVNTTAAIRSARSGCSASARNCSTAWRSPNRPAW